ncbi:32941_t:CDS:2 [Gigaspora margarita]|uniref:32941_t:CDS:1 n=1 Tax=Gigaspora margarita TaxID=4874 RepID=A0ABM8W3W5_GIGMA|nr:32941_t:CDS:2 [Gigaspora margarita]
MTEGYQNLHKRPRSVMQESVQSTSKVILNEDRKSYPFGTNTFGGVEKVVVTRKVRLCCFGSELVEWIFEKNGARLVVFSSDICTNNNETGELAKDLLSIVTVFMARHNGLHSAANCKRRKETAQAIQKFQEGSNETSSRQGTTHSSFSHSGGTYNQCLIAVEKEGVKRKRKDLRVCCLNAVNFQNKSKLKWILETLYDIRDEAMNDLLKEYKSNFAANHTNFKMMFRSKKTHNNQLQYFLNIGSLEIRAENQGPLFSENQEKSIVVITLLNNQLIALVLLIGLDRTSIRFLLNPDKGIFKDFLSSDIKEKSFSKDYKEVPYE